MSPITLNEACKQLGITEDLMQRLVGANAISRYDSDGGSFDLQEIIFWRRVSIGLGAKFYEELCGKPASKYAALTVETAATRLNKTPNTIQLWVNNGWLPITRSPHPTKNAHIKAVCVNILKERLRSHNLTLPNAAILLGASRHNVQTQIETGRVKAFEFGAQIYLRQEDVEALMPKAVPLAQPLKAAAQKVGLGESTLMACIRRYRLPAIRRDSDYLIPELALSFITLLKTQYTVPANRASRQLNVSIKVLRDLTEWGIFDAVYLGKQLYFRETEVGFWRMMAQGEDPEYFIRFIATAYAMMPDGPAGSGPDDLPEPYCLLAEWSEGLNATRPQIRRLLGRPIGFSRLEGQTYFLTAEARHYNRLLRMYSLCTSEVLTILPLGHETIGRMIESGVFSHIVIDGRKRFSPVAIQALNAKFKQWPYTPAQVASRLCVTKTTVLAWIKEDLINYSNIHGRYLISREEYKWLSNVAGWDVYRIRALLKLRKSSQ